MHKYEIITCNLPTIHTTETQTNRSIYIIYNSLPGISNNNHWYITISICVGTSYYEDDVRKPNIQLPQGYILYLPEHQKQ
jgi:hypothetical protein